MTLRFAGWIRCPANFAIAFTFARNELLPAQIYHLERAGRAKEAKLLARERFLSGRDWGDLVDYVAAHKCVSADEVVSLLVGGDSNEQYLLCDLLPRIHTSQTKAQLLDALRSDPKRYREDFQRMWHVQTCLLKCDPSALMPLLEFALEHSDPGNDRVDPLLTCAWRARTMPDGTFVDWFRSQPIAVQKKAVGFLLLKPDLSRLTATLAFMRQHGLPIAARGSHMFGVPILDLTSDADVEQLLEALPAVEPADVLTARSALLAPFEAFVWHERAAFRRVARALLQARAVADRVLANAIRVLLFINDRDVVELSRPLRSETGVAASLAWMAPVLLDAVDELAELEVVATVSETSSNARGMAVAVAIYLGADPDELLAQVGAANPSALRGVETILLFQAIFMPFAGAVPLLSKTLDESPELHGLLGPVLTRLAEAGFPGIEALLVKAMSSGDTMLAENAIVALGRSRFRSTLPQILERARTANDERMRALAISAALASSPDSSDAFHDLWQLTPIAAHWRWMLAGRLRDVGEAVALVDFAVDPTNDWKSRRLAILAAGRLPFEAEIAAIAPAILNTRVVLAEDSLNFHTHSTLALLLRAVGVRDLVPRFRRGRDAFVQALAPIYEGGIGQLLDKRGVLSPREAVGWLWDRLESHGLARDPRAVDNVENELHLPLLHAAVLLVLRRLNRRDLLLAAFEEAGTNWLRIRSLAELRKCERLSPEDENRAQTVISTAPSSLQIILERIFDEKPRRERSETSRPSEATPTPMEAIRLSFDQAQAFRVSAASVNSKPIVVDIDEPQLRTLVSALDPAGDTEWRSATVAKPARVSLSETSWRLRGGSALEPVSPNHDQRSALRPAVAAANRFGVNIPWHRTALAGTLRKVYADRFFASLGARNERDTFVHIISSDPELLVPLFDEPTRVTQVLHLVDERLLPVVHPFLESGHGAFFHQLCRVICQVETSAVESSLTRAFRRWLVLLNQLQASPDHGNMDTSEWRVVWQTLSLLRRHRRFDSIPQVEYRLLEILTRHKQLWYGHRENILTLLADWPPAYLQFETEAFHHAVFEHYPVNKVEEYDDIADTLFRTFDHRTRIDD